MSSEGGVPGTPPEAAPQLRQALVQLRTKIDQHFDEAQRRSPDAFQCRPGCAQCCHPQLGIFEIEAAPVRASLAELARENPDLASRIRAQATRAGPLNRCALLVDQRCTVYEARPAMCRVQGLPIIDGPDDEVKHCELNFVADEVPSLSVLRFDRVASTLAIAAEMWSPGGERIALRKLAAEI